uniref:Uncharacterized protein n=1 Tax=viral metagenome TaxID=1070528 RepID=A0A6C0ETA9_9ZZZZ
MCFSANISLSFGIIGVLSSLYFYKKNIYASIGIFYFALMEILQFFQYKVINQCNNDYNKFLTNLGYIHICFQPLFFNLWLFAFINKPNFTYLYLSFFAGLLLISRLFFVKDKELCDSNNEPLCGKKTCSFSGKKHIAWNVRLRAAGKYWFTPSLGLHFFMWVMPALTIFQLKPILALILTGPYLGFLITDNIHEQPAVWCYTATMQMLLSFILI